MTILENMAMADNKGKSFGLKRGTDKKRIASVSYTHLDVYKRQVHGESGHLAMSS